ncbi:MAG: class I SAM-dependent methyltransferase [Phycisphaerales bacterium]|nr:MAG: class I SAM-dependent methyltransferase [Phycisphaerales bacterium]
MDTKTQPNAQFFSHFSREDKPTKTGAWLSTLFARRVFAYARPQSGASLLEIGPGRGDFARLCIEKGLEYTAVEANHEMAASLRAKGARVIHATVPPLPPLDSRFDFVVMINVMEHMNGMSDALDITRQIKDLLNPGGKLVICSPDYLNWRLHFFNCDFSHNYVTTRRRLAQLLLDAGLTNVRSRYISGLLSGFACLPTTALVSRLPFGILSAAFPDNRTLHKLYKGQLTLLRKVLIVAENPG